LNQNYEIILEYILRDSLFINKMLEMDVAKLKVVELRAELAKRGLDQKGKIDVIVRIGVLDVKHRPEYVKGIIMV